MTSLEYLFKIKLMPKRKTILATGETYHIFNRSLQHVPIFSTKTEFEQFLVAARYYLQKNPPVKLSYYRQQPDRYKLDFNKTVVRLSAHCLMPSHFHLLLTQLEDEGIKKYIHKVATSYSRYFNTKHERKGPLFESKFKAVRIESHEQLVHLSRYIHLNPVTAYLVEDPEDYQYSSYNIYLGKKKSDFVDPSDVLANFSTPQKYKKLVLDQKDYQKELDRIKHLTFN